DARGKRGKGPIVVSRFAFPCFDPDVEQLLELDAGVRGPALGSRTLERRVSDLVQVVEHAAPVVDRVAKLPKAGTGLVVRRVGRSDFANGVLGEELGGQLVHSRDDRVEIVLAGVE